MPKSVSLASPAVLDLLGDHHVAGLDVAVDDPARVRVLERVAQRDADPHDVEVRQRAVALEVAERAAAHELGDEVPRLVVVAGLVERDDPRVREPRGRQRLALGARVLLAVERDALDRDGAVEPLVVGQPDRAEAAAAEAPHQAVAVRARAGARPALSSRVSGCCTTFAVRQAPAGPCRVRARDPDADAELAEGSARRAAVILAPQTLR